MGLAECEVAGADIHASGSSGPNGVSSVVPGPTTIVLNRAVDGIAVVESLAVARFDADDQTTEESFYWPEIPANVVSDALAFRDRLADPAMLLAYKARLSSDAQGEGRVVIHHMASVSSLPFQAAATYEVGRDAPLAGPLEFDENGQQVTTMW
jgi:hypothetical protein